MISLSPTAEKSALSAVSRGGRRDGGTRPMWSWLPKRDEARANAVHVRWNDPAPSKRLASLRTVLLRDMFCCHTQTANPLLGA
jgi:hypothetical protein